MIRADRLAVLFVLLLNLPACEGDRTVHVKNDDNRPGAGNAGVGGGAGTAGGGSSSGGASAGTAAGGLSGSAGKAPGGAGGDGADSGGESGIGGGVGGQGAMGGEGGGPDITRSWTFDADNEGWNTGETEPPTLANLVTLVWSGDTGDPAPGTLEAIVPFDGPSQVVRVAVAVQADLSGKALTSRVQLLTGLDSDLASNPGAIRLYVRSGPTGLMARGPDGSLDETAAWFSLALDASDPESVEGSGSYDATDIREIGVEFGTAAATDSASVAVVFIDTVSY
jgi:hypothetical protein